MQELAKYRSVAKVFGWIYFIFSILEIVAITFLIFVVFYVLENPTFFDNLDPTRKAELEQRVKFGIFGLFYYIFGLCGSCVDCWISKGLIHASNMETSCEIAIPLAKRWRFWFIILTVAYNVMALIVFPVASAAIGVIFSLMIRGAICYRVHQYIQSLEQIVASNQALIV